LNCCGPKSYLDWTANRYFSCDKSNISPEACGVPYSCCRQMNDISVSIFLAFYNWTKLYYLYFK
ncbi:unnamed protein product, partial [Schistosoma curassoni]|uniref:Tetraspanin n=1 Tax=Schistosoma curassoni TaxID=6186 RepID=A0A183L1Q8_9TREM